MKSEDSIYMAERADQNAQKVENFRQEVNEEVREILMRVARLRTKIDECRGTSKNFAGFLLGSVDCYVEAFEIQVEKMNARLELDKKYWRGQA
mmetsp:Transcript_10526/g.14200  ORF Transcript_10526/g.14200 Transcript_10526/m.14200 type:complete len:93 (-) Transcript_10526:596-874(-)